MQIATENIAKPFGDRYRVHCFSFVFHLAGFHPEVHEVQDALLGVSPESREISTLEESLLGPQTDWKTRRAPRPRPTPFGLWGRREKACEVGSALRKHL